MSEKLVLAARLIVGKRQFLTYLKHSAVRAQVNAYVKRGAILDHRNAA
tara:strand:- start:4 stop:147 length:144 start_codon:yes stop_codon:yes gene_type:complete